MSRSWSEISLGCLGALALIAIVTVISSFLVVIVWGWVVPDVFSGAVEKGMLPASLTWIQALKLSILFSILGLSKSASTGKSKN